LKLSPNWYGFCRFPFLIHSSVARFILRFLPRKLLSHIPQARQLELQKEYQDTSKLTEGQAPLLQSGPGEIGASSVEAEEDYIAANQPIDLIKKWLERQQNRDHS